MKHYIGIDLGGTNTKIGVVDSEGNLLQHPCNKHREFLFSSQ